MVYNVKVYIRWIPSELNSSDRASRYHEDNSKVDYTFLLETLHREKSQSLAQSLAHQRLRSVVTSSSCRPQHDYDEEAAIGEIVGTKRDCEAHSSSDFAKSLGGTKSRHKAAWTLRDKGQNEGQDYNEGDYQSDW